MEVYDGSDSGMQLRGAWTVPGTLPSAVSVTPSSGSGSSQTFGFLFSDTRGYAAISSASIVFSSSGNACMLYYVRATNSLYMANDAGTMWISTPVKPGQNGTEQNSQCSVSGSGSSVSASGNNLTLNLAIS